MSYFPFPYFHGNEKSREYIESVAERFADSKHPGPVDIELNAEKNGYIMDYNMLSNNGCYLGMAVFETTNNIPVYDEDGNCARYYAAKKGTIIIDSRLLAKGNENRYRFTIGHEIGHLVLHSDIYADCSYSLSEEDNSVLCRTNYQKLKPEDRKVVDHLEIEANWFAAAVLMPKTAFLEFVSNYGSIADNIVAFVDDAAKTFIVSPHAVCLRLHELNIMDLSYETYREMKRSAA